MADWELYIPQPIKLLPQNTIYVNAEKTGTPGVILHATALNWPNQVING